MARAETDSTIGTGVMGVGEGSVWGGRGVRLTSRVGLCEQLVRS